MSDCVGKEIDRKTDIVHQSYFYPTGENKTRLENDDYEFINSHANHLHTPNSSASSLIAYTLFQIGSN